MSQEDTFKTVFSELLMISYLCGYPEQPSVGRVEEIMRRCVSLGPQGYGLALYALIVALSGGTIPYFTVMPVPFGHIGRVEKMCIIKGEALRALKITEMEGFFTSPIAKEIGEQGEYTLVAEYPEAFGVVVFYRDGDGRLNKRAFVVQHAQNSNYPWLSFIPSDEGAEAMFRLCEEDRDTLPFQELVKSKDMVKKVPKQAPPPPYRPEEDEGVPVEEVVAEAEEWEEEF